MDVQQIKNWIDGLLESPGSEYWTGQSRQTVNEYVIRVQRAGDCHDDNETGDYAEQMECERIAAEIMADAAEIAAE